MFALHRLPFYIKLFALPSRLRPLPGGRMAERGLVLRTLRSAAIVAALLIASLGGIAREGPLSATAIAALQPPAQGRGGAPVPAVTSPEVGPDRRVTFRI